MNFLLESRNQVEILESRIIISTFILGYLVFLNIMKHVMHKPLFGKQKSQESIQEYQNKTNIPKIPESCQRKFRVVDPLPGSQSPGLTHPFCLKITNK